eukprot:4427135-Pleurochrysis_carterae.AAC.1
MHPERKGCHRQSAHGMIRIPSAATALDPQECRPDGQTDGLRYLMRFKFGRHTAQHMLYLPMSWHRQVRKRASEVYGARVMISYARASLRNASILVMWSYLPFKHV